MIELPNLRQPLGKPNIDRKNPLAAGLIDVAFPYLQKTAEGDFGMVTGASVVPNAVGARGRATRITAEGSHNVAFSGGWSKRGAPMTLVAVYRLTATPALAVRLVGNWNASASGYALSPNATNFRALVSRAGANLTLTGNAVSQDLQVDVLVIDGTNASYYQNGVLVAGPTSHGGMVAANQTFTFGSTTLEGSSARAEHYYAGVWNRCLSAAEAEKIASNPWQLFEGQTIYVKSAAAGTTVAPTKGTLTFTGKQPSIAQTANQTVEPAKGALTFGGKTPTIAQTANQTVAPTKGALTFTGKQPTVSQDSGAVVSPTKGALTFQGGIPSVTQTANQIIVPSKGSLVFGGKTPTVEQSGAVTYARAPRGGGYPATVPTTERYGMSNTKRPAMTNTRR